MEFKEALEILAQKAGVTLKRSSDKKNIQQRLYELNQKAQQYYHYILTEHSFGKKALDYLQKRGVNSSSIKLFSLGYAPNSWDSLTKFLLKRGFNTYEFSTSGLGVASKSSAYDRFRGRIIFPLIDSKDRTVGFAGRVLVDSSLSGPKYINSPQTPIFDKSNFLFGLNLTKGDIRAKNEVILVEGEMDMILSYQSGIKNVAASKGTALTQKQIENIKKFTQNLSICFDTDLAGDAASRRGIEMADSAGLNIKIIQVEEGKDPAEVIKKDAALWQKAKDDARPVYDYYLRSIASRYNPLDPADLVQISAELIPIWAKISDDLKRDHYIQKLSSFLKIDEEILRKNVNKARQLPSLTVKKVYQDIKKDDILKRSRREILEEYLVALLLRIPKNIIFVPSFPETIFTLETWRQVYVLLVLYLDSIAFKGQYFDINQFQKNVPKELSEEIDRLYLTELDAKLTDKNFWQKELEIVVAELKKALIKASLEKMSYEIKNAQSFGKMELLNVLTKRFRDLSVKLKNL